jgi:hypothetical protein
MVYDHVVNKNTSNKKIIKEYFRLLKTERPLKAQYFMYENLCKKTFDTPDEAKEYIKTNIRLAEKLGLKNIKKSNNLLLSLLKDNNIKIVESENKLHKFIDVLINEDDVTKIEEIHESFNNIKDHLLINKITELKNVDWVGAQVPLSLISKLAASKYNRKYADLAEGEKKIVRTVIKGNPEEKKELHATLIEENITLVNNRLSETSDIDIKEKLLEVKEKLLNFDFSKDEYVNNIIKLNTLRLDLIQK